MSNVNHVVVSNDDGQYSIWPEHRVPPSGWKAMAIHGSSTECLAWIDAHWQGPDCATLQGSARLTDLQASRCRKHVPVLQLIEDQVVSTPDAVAVVLDQDCLTYSQLDAKATEVAALIRSHTKGAGHLIGVCVKRSIELPAILLGVWKAGSAYVPLDPSHPPARLQTIAQSARPQLVLVDEAGAEHEFDLSVPTIRIDGVRAAVDARTMGPCAPDAAAYVMYTSGSTGTPKGVVVDHANLSSLFHALATGVEVDARSVWLAITTFSFDISVPELLLPLAHGGKVIIGNATDDVFQLVTREQVTHLQCTPSLAHLLVDHANACVGNSLRYWLVGGEALTAELSGRMHALAPNTHLLNVYGPTETTVWSTSHLVGNQTEAPPIGQALENEMVYVIDEDYRQCAEGCVGEILIGGAGVAQGYYLQAAMTAERFVPDPFSSVPGSRAYRTGDQGRFVHGVLEFAGRRDSQVKVNGFRIELTEIEGHLSAHHAVQQCAVVAANVTLIAYCVLRKAIPVTAEQLQDHLRERVPRYMLPSRFMRVEGLPLTPNGKVDRSALGTQDAPGTWIERAYVPPRTATERQLAQIWCDLLGVSGISISDSFFQLGGHSLLVPRMLDEIRQRLRKSLSPEAIFASPSLESLASEVDALIEPSCQASSAAVTARIVARERLNRLMSSKL